jgi:hypothetical protein
LSAFFCVEISKLCFFATAIERLSEIDQRHEPVPAESGIMKVFVDAVVPSYGDLKQILPKPSKS